MADKLEMKTKELSQENIAKIQAIFPNCVTEVMHNGKVELAVDFDALKQELSGSVVHGPQERYQMTWPEKSKAKVLAGSPISATLRPCMEKSDNFESTKNIYIEGDNLDVLKLLRETYLGKVDVIYIDPPYNTGNSLIYYNDFFQDSSDYVLETSGQYDDLGNRLVQNAETNGRFHTDWLNMIYPRLKIAKDLLKDTGILVLTIDDYELNTVTTVLNEIFGEKNHLATVVIKNNPSGRSTVKGFSINHEYALFYSRSDNAVLGRMKHTDAQKARYKEKDEIGFFEWENFRKNGTDSDRGDRPKQFYPIVINKQNNALRIPQLQWDDSKKAYIILEEIGGNEEILWPITPAKQEKVWKYGLERTKQIIGELLVKPTDYGYEIYRKKYINDEGSLPHTWWDKPEYSARDNGTRTLTNIFGPGKVFDFPKAPEAVKDALITANLQENGLVLDFFSGSATTAQAVFQLNVEDGGNRRFILVQLPEPCEEGGEAFKAGFNNICEIGEERIRRIGKTIKEEGGILAQNLDTGFRVFRLDSSNMQDVYYNPSAITQSILEQTIDNVKLDRTPLDLLFQVMLELGVELSAKIEEKTINGKKYYVVNDNEIVACFDDDIDNDVITAIAKQQPIYAIFKDRSFASDSVGINNEQLFKTYSPSTEIKVI